MIVAIAWLFFQTHSPCQTIDPPTRVAVSEPTSNRVLLIEKNGPYTVIVEEVD